MTEIPLEQRVLARNDAVADANRELFRQAGAYAVNLISSPGAGKTTLLEATLGRLAGRARVAVVEGDVQTENDADRVAATGVPVEAIVTGGACHLDAAMVRRAFRRLDERLDGPLDLLIIENVGNLVCPSSYDLGEDEKVALVSVTEGEDKPLKYPSTFHTADLVVISKIDLAEAVGFDRAAARAAITAVAPRAAVVEVSARTGEGIADLLGRLLPVAAASGRG